MTQIFEQLELNSTFFVQFVLFGVFFFILSAVYLRPFQKLIESRNQKLQGDVQSATELLKAVESKLADYEKAISAARAEARQESERAIAEVRAKEESAIATYKDELKKEYHGLVQKLQAEKAGVEAELGTQVSQMADSVVQKILGK